MFLPDGPLMAARAFREGIVLSMAQDLVDCDAFADINDARRCLLAKRYLSVHIVAWLADARQVAMQTVVARVMMEP